MDPVSPKRSSSVPGLVFAICFLVIAGAAIVWFRIDTKSHVLARLKNENDNFLVVQKVDGKIDVLLASWTVELWWKRSSQWWSCFTLDYEASRWSDVEIRRDGDHVLISKAGKVASSLSLADHRLENFLRNTMEYPVFLTNRDPLLNDEGRLRIYPESKGWPAAWSEFAEHGDPLRP